MNQQTNSYLKISLFSIMRKASIRKKLNLVKQLSNMAQNMTSKSSRKL